MLKYHKTVQVYSSYSCKLMLKMPVTILVHKEGIFVNNVHYLHEVM